MRWKENNNRIIDIGCGDGSVTNILKKYFPPDFTLVGADISEDMVRFANVNHRDKQASFIVLDIAGDLPEAMKENFNQVFSFFTLNWVMDQERAFKNIFKLLDQDGECFLILAASCTIYDAYRIFSKDSKWSTWIHDVDKYISPYHDTKEPDKEIMKLMENIGFVNIEVECKDMVCDDDINILSKLLMAINPFQIPKANCNDFLKDYIQVLKDIDTHKVDDENSSRNVKVSYKLVTVYAHKPSAVAVRV